MRKLDLHGMRFGKLTVISSVDGGKWHCKCDCGNEVDVFTENLRKGHTKSCGCLKGTGIIGKKYNKLTVLKLVEDDKYECECECGNKRIVPYNSLTSGIIKACRACAKESHAAAVRESICVDGTQPAQLHSKITKANKSGVVGVNWDKSRGKWQASIKFKGHKYNLGRFENIQDAIDVREEAEKRIFGSFLEIRKGILA